MKLNIYTSIEYILNMASHQISIRNEIYHKLLNLKKENESFSDLLDRLSEQEKGSWKSLEKLNGIAGPDDLGLEKIVAENRSELEESMLKRLNVQEKQIK